VIRQVDISDRQAERQVEEHEQQRAGSNPFQHRRRDAAAVARQISDEHAVNAEHRS